MNEQEKSLKLAALMGWEVIMDSEGVAYRTSYRTAWCSERLNPYDSMTVGRSQFAATLLKFPEVMLVWQRYLDEKGSMVFLKEPTQSNILDEILTMNGVEI